MREPAFSTPSVVVYLGDSLTVLREMPDASVDCVVTSPPYWGLRDYGAAGQLGLEATPQLYVAAMVEVFREVRRVLSDSGTLWLNLGDSYTGSGKGGNPDEGKQATNRGSQTIGTLYGKVGETARQAALTNVGRRWTTEAGMAPKNLVGIPWRVAFALQADGWYLRSDIIWSKPNPMPESVTDRPTKAHEYVFLMSKSERYFYDAAAIAEDAIYKGITGMDASGFKDPQTFNGKHSTARMFGARTPIEGEPATARNARTVWTIATQPYAEAHFATFPRELPERCIKAGCPEGGVVLDPFAGSGTTLAVARDLGRKSIGIELNPEYVRLIERRCAQLSLEIPA